MKQRRRIRREAVLLLVGLFCSSGPSAVGFSPTAHQQQQRPTSSQLTSRYATIENESRTGTSSDSDDNDQIIEDALRRRRSELGLANDTIEEEPFFAQKTSSTIDPAGISLNRTDAIQSRVNNGISVPQKNGVSDARNGASASRLKKNGVKQKNGVHTASPQPAPVSSFQGDIQNRIIREKVPLDKHEGSLPGLLGIIEKMNTSRRKIKANATSTPVADVESEADRSVSEQEKAASDSNSNSNSILSFVSSAALSTASKVRNGWHRVSPFGTSAVSAEEDISAINATDPSSTSAETSKNKTQTKQEAVVARMSRKKKKQLSNLLKKVNKRTTKNLGGITARTLSGLISAIAEEVDGLNVQLHAQENTPFWRKQIDSVSIEFTRLGFKPLHMGGPDQQIRNNLRDEKLQKQRALKVKKEQEQLRLAIQTQKEALEAQDYMEDDCPVEYATDDDGNTIATLSCADTAFQQIDVDNSGALDKDEIAEALVLAASSMEAKQSGAGRISGAVADIGASTRTVIQGLAKQLVELYDTNNDGVIDRSEYQNMVEDMAALRELQKKEEQKKEEKLQEAASKGSSWWNSAASSIFRGNDSDEEELDEMLIQQLNDQSVVDVTNSAMGEEIMNLAGLSDEVSQTLGKIELENLKMDMRQVLFGAIPIIKRVTPGGPLFLEPFTVKITGSVSAEDVMKSSLLDAGLRQLVSFALRRRVRSFRDLVDGAVFHGRKWKRGSAKAPLVECTELTSVEIDDQDRLIITGRAKVRASEDAPVIDNSFKLRTRIANPRNGRAIKLSDPEIAIVLECPPSVENSINATFSKLNMKPPSKPRPIYTYIPIQSPFNKDDDTGGYYMGEDNRIKSIFVKDKCLRFELETILRPGRFLGNHYLAFTVPQRALIITVDRVKNGIRAARRRKKALKAMQKARAHELEEKAHHAEDALAMISTYDDYGSAAQVSSKEAADVIESAPGKGFISRFVDGYLQAGASDEREKLTVAISDWFGRQGTSDSEKGSAAGIEAPRAQDGVTTVIEDITMEHIMDDESKKE